MADEVWAFIETEGNGRLHDTALKMASEAKRISKIFGAKPCGVLFNFTPDSIKDLHPYGLEKVYFFQADETPTPATAVTALLSLVSRESPAFFLFASTIMGSELGASLAARLKSGLIANYVDIESQDGLPIARKPLYGKKAHLMIKWATPPPHIATVDLDSLEAVEAEQDLCPETVLETFDSVTGACRLLERWRVPPSEQHIAEADLVIGVGKGVDKKEFMETIEELARTLGGVVGGTRIALFQGRIPKERLLGTSGNWITPKIYIAIGISGAPQHVMGIKDATHIIAINRARNAPIFRYAELGIVGDLYKVVPKILAGIEALKIPKPKSGSPSSMGTMGNKAAGTTGHRGKK